MSAEPWRWRGGATVLGVGAALPGAPITTVQLLELVADRMSPAARRRARAVAGLLGVERRHAARNVGSHHSPSLPGCSNPELAATALTKALADAGLKPGDLGFLIGHTTTPAQLLPANIAAVAEHIGYLGPILELRQACTGFANALAVAIGMLALDPSRPVAIVGSETGSQHLDLTDPEDDGQLVNLLQMGDGAGAIILGGGSGRGLIEAAWSGASGLSMEDGIRLAAGSSRFEQPFAAIKRKGPLLFERGWSELGRVGYDDADWIIPHQASGNIGTALARHLGIAEDRFFVNGNNVGNTGSAAIWIAFAELVDQLAAGERVGVLGAESAAYLYGGFAYRHG